MLEDKAKVEFQKLFNPSDNVNIFPDFDTDILQDIRDAIPKIQDNCMRIRREFAGTLEDTNHGEYVKNRIADIYYDLELREKSLVRESMKLEIQADKMDMIKKYPGIDKVTRDFRMYERNHKFTKHVIFMVNFTAANQALILIYLQLNAAYYHEFKRLKSSEENFLSDARNRFIALADYYPLITTLYTLLTDMALANFLNKQYFERVVANIHTHVYYPSPDSISTLTVSDLIYIARTTAEIKGNVLAFRSTHMNDLITAINSLSVDDNVERYIRVYEQLRATQETCEEKAMEYVETIADNYGCMENHRSVPMYYASIHARLCVATYISSETKAPRNDFRVKCEEWIINKGKDLPEEAVSSSQSTADYPASASSASGSGRRRPPRKLKSARALFSDASVEPKTSKIQYDTEKELLKLKYAPKVSQTAIDVLRHHYKLPRSKQSEDIRKMHAILNALNSMYNHEAHPMIGRCLRCKKPIRLQALKPYSKYARRLSPS
jgi:hypothetical protein